MNGNDSKLSLKYINTSNIERTTKTSPKPHQCQCVQHAASLLMNEAQCQNMDIRREQKQVQNQSGLCNTHDLHMYYVIPSHIFRSAPAWGLRFII